MMRLTGEEFVRRYLMHVLPPGFMRIRHYGYMANCHRREKLRQIRQCLNAPQEDACSVVASTATARAVESRDPATQSIGKCPRCQRRTLRITANLPKRRLRRACR